MCIGSLDIIDFRERTTNALIRLLGCSDRSVPLLFACNKTRLCFFKGTSAAICDKFAMCYSCKKTPKEVAALLPPISDVHLDTLSY